MNCTSWRSLLWSVVFYIWTEYGEILIRRETPYLTVFSPVVGKCWPEILRIWTLFTQFQCSSYALKSRIHFISHNTFAVNRSLNESYFWRGRMHTSKLQFQQLAFDFIKEKNIYKYFHWNYHQWFLKSILWVWE